jgi:hypothetical protein
MWFRVVGAEFDVSGCVICKDFRLNGSDTQRFTALLWPDQTDANYYLEQALL